MKDPRRIPSVPCTLAGFGLLSLASALGVAAADAGPALQRYAHASMGTVLEVEWLGAENSPERITPALDEVDLVEAVVSHWNPESEIRRFNGLLEGIAHTPSPILLELFEAAERWRIETGGAFTCRLFPWLRAHGFLPESAGIDPHEGDLRPLVLPSAVVLEESVLRKNRSEAGLDFNGIAKGYALDRAADSLRRKEIEAFLSYHSTGIVVGESMARPLMILDPRSSGVDADPIAAVWVDEGAFSTSSCAENTRDGQCHIVNPESLLSVKHGLLSATIFAQKAADADAASTAAMSLGPEGALVLLSRADLEGVLISRESLPGAVFTRGLWVFASRGIRYRFQPLPE